MVFHFEIFLWDGKFGLVLPPVFTKWYEIMIDIMKLMFLTLTPSAYSAPGTPPANRTSFVGVTPRDPGGLYQAQVSVFHLTLSGEIQLILQNSGYWRVRSLKDLLRKQINPHLAVMVSTNPNSSARCFYRVFNISTGETSATAKILYVRGEIKQTLLRLQNFTLLKLTQRKLLNIS